MLRSLLCASAVVCLCSACASVLDSLPLPKGKPLGGSGSGSSMGGGDSVEEVAAQQDKWDQVTMPALRARDVKPLFVKVPEYLAQEVSAADQSDSPERWNLSVVRNYTAKKNGQVSVRLLVLSDKASFEWQPHMKPGHKDNFGTVVSWGGLSVHEAYPEGSVVGSFMILLQEVTPEKPGALLSFNFNGMQRSQAMAFVKNFSLKAFRDKVAAFENQTWSALDRIMAQYGAKPFPRGKDGTAYVTGHEPAPAGGEPWSGLCTTLPAQLPGLQAENAQGNQTGNREDNGMTQLYCSRHYQAGLKFLDVAVQASTYDKADNFPSEKPGWRFVSQASPESVEQVREINRHLVYLSHDSKTRMGSIKVRLKKISPAKAFGGWIDVGYAKMGENEALELVKKLDWKAMRVEIDRLK